MPTAKQDKTRKNGLTVKDLIVMGVFGALLMVCSMIGGVLFAVTPTLTFYFSIGAALLPGPVFLLLLAKVPKRWGLTIIGVIISLLSLIMGMHWVSYILLDQWEPILLILLIQKDGQVPCCRMEQHKIISMP